MVIIGLVFVSLVVHFQKDLRVTTLFSDAIVLDPFASFFKQIVILATILVSIVSLFSGELDEYRKGEYFALLGIVTFGLFLMVSSIDLIMIYISIEIVSIISFVLAGYLKKKARSNEAALKYVVYGGFSSGIMLFGLSYIFGLTGSTNIFEIQQTVSQLDPASSTALTLAILMVLAGLDIKFQRSFSFLDSRCLRRSSSLHYSLFICSPKAAAFALMIRFLTRRLLMECYERFRFGLTYPATMAEILSILSVATMTLGNVVALQQKSIKRMLAYSSIAHAGYMLLAMPVMSGDSIYAIMMYLVMYLL